MSTILKALRRLERDKALPAESQSLREAVTAGGEEPRRGAGQPVWLVPSVALLFGIGVGAGVLLLWPHSEVEAATGNDTVVVAPARPAPPALTPPTPSPAPVFAAATSPAAPSLPQELQEIAKQVGLPAAAFASSVEVVSRPDKSPRIEAPPMLPEPEEVAQAAPAKPEVDPWLLERPPPAPAPFEKAPATSLPEPPAPTLPVVRETRRVIPFDKPPALEASPGGRAAPEPASPPAPHGAEWESAPKAEATVVKTPPAPTPLPVVEPAQPAPEQAASKPPAPPPAPAPAFRVERTWWHPSAPRREALVELGGDERRVREGDLVGDAVVVKIESSAVVFSRGETEFRHHVGEAEAQ